MDAEHYMDMIERAFDDPGRLEEIMDLAEADPQVDEAAMEMIELRVGTYAGDRSRVEEGAVGVIEPFGPPPAEG